MFEMTDQECQEWGEIGEPINALHELFMLCDENGYEWLVNNPDQLHPFLNYLNSKMTKEQFNMYKSSYDQIVSQQFERMDEDEDYDMFADSSADDKLKEILQQISVDE